MEHDDLLLAFDVGTTAVKGALYTADGRCVFTSGIGYPKVSARTGWVEQNPQDWLDCMASLIERMARRFDLRQLVGVGICSQVNTHVFVDTEGKPLMNAIVWEDQRCAEVTEKLNRLLNSSKRENDPVESRLDSSSLVSRAEWVKRHRPEVWGKTRFILSPKDYCILQLTGESVADILSSVGLVNAEGGYDDDLLRLVDGLPQRVPPLRPMQQIAGNVKNSRLGLRAGCPVAVGTMDCWASLFGSGEFRHGHGFQVAGTSEILGLVSERAEPASGIVTFPRYRGLYLHAGPTQAGGDALQWYANSQDKSVADILRAVDGTSTNQDPLVFLPYLMGERAPIWDPKARGAFIGLTKNHRTPCLARAVMEGVGFAARHLLEHLQQAAGYDCVTLVISGGAASSDQWCQMKADIMNCTLNRVENIDTGVFGAALIAAVGTGIYRNLDEAIAQSIVINRSFVPQPTRRESYDALYQVYRESYRHLRPVFDSLYQITETRPQGISYVDSSRH